MPLLLQALVVLALIQGVVSLRDGRQNLRYARRPPRPDAGSSGRVIVFCPVRGAAADLPANAQSLVTQSHPDHRVVFVVESESDPAFPVLSALETDRVEVLVAGAADGRGQKVHNLATAVAVAGAGASILAFADADAYFPREWLSELVAPLTDPAVGAVTGYRWYVTGPRASLPSRLRSAWNASIAGFLGPHGRNFAWGGSMALRRETFDRTRVADHWSGALSDDYALTRAVRRAGLDIVFVPSCLVASRGRCTWRELVEFTTRQVRITRIYAPRVWTMALASYTLFNVTFVWLTSSLGGGGLPAVLWLTLMVLAGVRADARVQAARLAVADAAPGLMRVFHVLAPPLVSLLYQWNLLASLASRRIRWKGTVYTMVSASQTRVDREP